MAFSKQAPLGLIAGSGHMPRLLHEACSQRPVFVLAYHGQTDPTWVASTDHLWFYLGELGKALKSLKERGIQEVVMAGGFSRPSLRQMKADKVGLAFLARLGLRWPGDDFLLTSLHKFLESEGFTLKSPQEIMPTLKAPFGAFGHVTPSPEAMLDIQKGTAALEALSPLDCGQGLSIQNGLILAIEAAEGTDLCILRSEALCKKEDPPPVYIKRPKVSQSEVMDPPVVGPRTVQALIKAGFQGLSFQADKTLILFPDETRALADQNHLFLWGAP